MLPSAGVNFTAFDNRFPRSAGSGGVAGDGAELVDCGLDRDPLRRGRGADTLHRLLDHVREPDRGEVEPELADTMRDTSRRSSMILPARFALRSDGVDRRLTLQRRSLRSSATGPPGIAVSGVRSS